MNGVREALKWFDLYLKLGSSQRKNIRETVLKSLSEYSAKGEGHSDHEAGIQLVKSLKANFDYIGIAPNIMYAKEKGTKDDLKAIWVHPWGVPTLVYKHKKLPMIALVNPGIRYNESFIREMSMNRENLSQLYELAGITG